MLINSGDNKKSFKLLDLFHLLTYTQALLLI